MNAVKLDMSVATLGTRVMPSCQGQGPQVARGAPRQSPTRKSFRATEIARRLPQRHGAVAEPSTSASSTFPTSSTSQEFSEAVKTLQMDMGFCRINQPYSPAMLEERVFQVRGSNETLEERGRRGGRGRGIAEPKP